VLFPACRQAGLLLSFAQAKESKSKKNQARPDALPVGNLSKTKKKALEHQEGNRFRKSRRQITIILDTDHKKGGELFLRRTRRVLSLNCLKSFSNHYI